MSLLSYQERKQIVEAGLQQEARRFFASHNLSDQTSAELRKLLVQQFWLQGDGIEEQRKEFNDICGGEVSPHYMYHFTHTYTSEEQKKIINDIQQWMYRKIITMDDVDGFFKELKKGNSSLWLKALKHSFDFYEKDQEKNCWNFDDVRQFLSTIEDMDNMWDEDISSLQDMVEYGIDVRDICSFPHESPRILWFLFRVFAEIKKVHLSPNVVSCRKIMHFMKKHEEKISSYNIEDAVHHFTTGLCRSIWDWEYVWRLQEDKQLQSEVYKIYEMFKERWDESYRDFFDVSRFLTQDEESEVAMNEKRRWLVKMINKGLLDVYSDTDCLESFLTLVSRYTMEAWVEIFQLLQDLWLKNVEWYWIYVICRKWNRSSINVDGLKTLFVLIKDHVIDWVDLYKIKNISYDVFCDDVLPVLQKRYISWWKHTLTVDRVISIMQKDSEFCFEKLFKRIDDDILIPHHAWDRDALVSLLDTPGLLDKFVEVGYQWKQKWYGKYRLLDGYKKALDGQRKNQASSIEDCVRDMDLMTHNDPYDFRSMMLNVQSEWDIIALKERKKQFFDAWLHWVFNLFGVHTLWAQKIDPTRIFPFAREWFFNVNDYRALLDMWVQSDSLEQVNATLVDMTHIMNTRIEKWYDRDLRDFGKSLSLLRKSHTVSYHTYVSQCLAKWLFTKNDRDAFQRDFDKHDLEIYMSDFFVWCEKWLYKKGDLKKYLQRVPLDEAEKKVVTIMFHEISKQQTLHSDYRARYDATDSALQDTSESVENTKPVKPKNYYDDVRSYTWLCDINDALGGVVSSSQLSIQAWQDLWDDPMHVPLKDGNLSLKNIIDLIQNGYFVITSRGENQRSSWSDIALILRKQPTFDLRQFMENNANNLTIRNVADALQIDKAYSREQMQKMSPILQSDFFSVPMIQWILKNHGDWLSDQNKKRFDFVSMFDFKKYILDHHFHPFFTKQKDALLHDITGVGTSEIRKYLKDMREVVAKAQAAGEYLEDEHYAILQKKGTQGKRGDHISEIMQGNMSNCYFLAGTTSYKYRHFFETQIRLARKKVDDGWLITIPYDDPDGQKYHVSESEVEDRTPDDMDKNTIAQWYNQWVNSPVWANHVNNSFSGDVYTNGFKIAEIAKGKWRKKGGKNHRESLASWNPSRSMYYLLGNSATYKEESLDFSCLSHLEIKKVLQYFAQYHKWIVLLMPMVDFLSSNAMVTQYNETAVYNNHGYAITDVNLNDDGGWHITVRNPHNTSKTQDYTLLDFLKVFTHLSVLQVDIKHMWDKYKKKYDLLS